MKLKSIALVTTLVTLITGCGLQSNDKSTLSVEQKNTSQIFGGTEADAAFQQKTGVVGLTLVMKSIFGYGLGTCSGTLIDKKIILTAAHCLMGDQTTEVVAVGVSFNNNIQKLQDDFFTMDEAAFAAAGVVFVDAVAVHPEFMKGIETEADYATKPWNDVALLRLSQDAPANFNLAQLPTNTDIASFTTQSKLVLAGFGMSTAIANEIVIDPKTGKQKVQPVKDAGLTAGVLRTADNKTVTQIRSDNLEFSIESSQSGSCHGDSGGPAFLARADGSLFQVGVADRTSNNIGNCNEFMVYTNVIGHLGWINQSVPALLAEKVPAPTNEPNPAP